MPKARLTLMKIGVLPFLFHFAYFVLFYWKKGLDVSDMAERERANVDGGQECVCVCVGVCECV